VVRDDVHIGQRQIGVGRSGNLVGHGLVQRTQTIAPGRNMARRSIEWRCIALHCIALHCFALRCVAAQRSDVQRRPAGGGPRT
jgi:hypothetical protein